MNEIFIMKGNHDENVAKKLDRKFPLSLLMSAAFNGEKPECDVYVTDRDWMMLGDGWEIGHLSQYSRTPGKKACSIAEKRKKIIAVGHDHIQGFMSSLDGNHIGISVGSMLLPNRFWYVEERFNDFPNWKNGFLIVKDGFPYLFNENGSSPLNGSKRWDYWEGELNVNLSSIFDKYASDNKSELIEGLTNYQGAKYVL
jgi:hypothetical protein